MFQQPCYDEISDEKPTFELLRQKIDEFTIKFAEASKSVIGFDGSVKEELEKVDKLKFFWFHGLVIIY